MRVLIVDDSSAARTAMRRILEDIGCATGEATHGLEAAEMLEAGEAYDLLLIDWNMPELDGVGLVKRIREANRQPRATILMVTSETEQSRIAEALQAGADEYLMKPFDRDSLLSKMELLGLAPESTD
jgi:two-component system chemotaxis response regulator CheY